SQLVSHRHLPAPDNRADQHLIHWPVQRSKALWLMTAHATHRPPDDGFGKLLSKTQTALLRIGITKTRSKLGLVQVLVKARRPVISEAFVDYLYQRLLFLTYTSLYRKDRQNTALMTASTIIVAVSEFPATFDGYRAVPMKRSERVLEIGVERPIRTRH